VARGDLVETKDVEGYEGRYKITDDGRVYSCISQKWLKPFVMRDGYLGVCLHKDGKQKTLKVHRLVAVAFVKNPHRKNVVNHLNEDKTDNRAENIEWSTVRENINWGTRTKRAKEKQSYPVIQVSMDYKSCKIYPSIIAAERETGIQNINACLSGKYKTAGGYRWVLANPFTRRKSYKGDL
jgi:hypothetical protein